MTTEAPFTPPTSSNAPALAPGDIVRVKDPEGFISSFAKKVKDRDAQVLWVGPTPDGGFRNRAKVRFLKRNGRGKEFEEVLMISSLVRMPGTPDSSR